VGTFLPSCTPSFVGAMIVENRALHISIAEKGGIDH
jgi:hypothetical protein